jgi:hypothetical protein
VVLTASIVLVIIVTSAVAIWADGPRYPPAPDRQRDLDLRRKLWR